MKSCPNVEIDAIVVLPDRFLVERIEVSDALGTNVKMARVGVGLDEASPNYGLSASLCSRGSSVIRSWILISAIDPKLTFKPPRNGI
jgi:hypothetical protein